MLISACNTKNTVPSSSYSTRNAVTENINQTVKDTPILFGSGTSKPTVRGYSYDKLIEEADLIAKVKIVEWLGESNDPTEQTFFKAELLNVLKGADVKNNKYIEIRQEGSSSTTIKDFPLFKNNDKLILFLKKGDGNVYWICGTYSTVVYVKESSNKEYA